MYQFGWKFVQILGQALPSGITQYMLYHMLALNYKVPKFKIKLKWYRIDSNCTTEEDRVTLIVKKFELSASLIIDKSISQEESNMAHYWLD